MNRNDLRRWASEIDAEQEEPSLDVDFLTERLGVIAMARDLGEDGIYKDWLSEKGFDVNEGKC